MTKGKGADVIFDPVGGDVFDKSTKCVAFEGRIVVVGFASGDIPKAALNHALVKNYDILGLQGRTYRFLESDAIREHYQKLLALTETRRDQDGGHRAPVARRRPRRPAPPQRRPDHGPHRLYPVRRSKPPF